MVYNNLRDIRYLLTDCLIFKKKLSGRQYSPQNYFKQASLSVIQKILPYILDNTFFYLEDVLIEKECKYFVAKNHKVMHTDSNGKHKLFPELVEKIKSDAEKLIYVRDSRSITEDDEMDEPLEFQHVERLTEEVAILNPDKWSKHLKSLDSDFEMEGFLSTYLIPKENLDFSSLVYNFSIAISGKIIYNPDIELSDTLEMNESTLQHVKAKVSARINISEILPISGQVYCPQCRSRSKFKYFRVNRGSINCESPFAPNQNGICGKNLSIKEAQIVESKDLFFYRVMFQTSQGQKEHIVASLCELLPGVHNIQVLVRNTGSGGILVIAKDYYEIDLQEKFLDFTKDDKFEDRMKFKGLPCHNIFLINDAIKKMLKSKGVYINNTGTILALSMIIQCFDKLYDDRKMINLLALAPTAFGKSYITKIYGNVLFPKFLYIENSQRISLPRLGSGVEKIFLDGKERRIQTQGIFSEYDYVMFNEGTDMLGTDRGNDIAQFFKAVLDDTTITTMVMGGQTVQREAMIGIVGNYSPKMNFEYEKKVQKEYYRILRAEFGDDAEQNTLWNSDWPILFRLFYFNNINDELYLAHKRVRQGAYNLERDFVLDVELATLRRFPLFFRLEKVGEDKSIDRQSHMTFGDMEIKSIVDSMKIQKELKDAFPKIILTDAERNIVYDFLDEVFENKDIQIRGIKENMYMYILEILMSINKETKLSEETKEVFRMLFVEPCVDFLSLEKYNMQNDIMKEKLEGLYLLEKIKDKLGKKLIFDDSQDLRYLKLFKKAGYVIETAEHKYELSKTGKQFLILNRKEEQQQLKEKDIVKKDDGLYDFEEDDK